MWLFAESRREPRVEESARFCWPPALRGFGETSFPWRA